MIRTIASSGHDTLFTSACGRATPNSSNRLAVIYLCRYGNCRVRKRQWFESVTRTAIFVRSTVACRIQIRPHPTNTSVHHAIIHKTECTTESFAIRTIHIHTHSYFFLGNHSYHCMKACMCIYLLLILIYLCYHSYRIHLLSSSHCILIHWEA